jgi:hypothetical protein
VKHEKLGATAAPIVQQGPLPVFYITGIASMDVGAEVVIFTFCADQRWGGAQVMERELMLRTVMARSQFDAMRIQVNERVEGGDKRGH